MADGVYYLLVDTTFGQHVRLLRDTRRLTRLQLAIRSQLSESTLRTLETDPKYTPRRSNLIAVMQALDEVEPLTEKEGGEFLRLCGQREVARSVIAAIAAIKEDAANHTPQPVQPTTPKVPPGRARIYSLIDEMADVYGDAALLRLLNSLAAMQSPPPSAAPAAGSLFRVHHPLVQRDGYTEQIIVDYENVTHPPAAPRARGNIGKAS